MRATPECFSHLTQLLQVLAGGRVCAVLEVTVTAGRAHWSDAGVPSEGACCTGRGILPGMATPRPSHIPSFLSPPREATTWSRCPSPCAWW